MHWGIRHVSLVHFILSLQFLVKNYAIKRRLKMISIIVIETKMFMEVQISVLIIGADGLGNIHFQILQHNLINVLIAKILPAVKMA